MSVTTFRDDKFLNEQFAGKCTDYLSICFTAQMNYILDVEGFVCKSMSKSP